MAPTPLRVRTWLAPGYPAALFGALARHLGRRLGTSARLTVDVRRSGPLPDRLDPFTRGAVDIGFCCAPTYVWLADRPHPAVRLVPAAPVLDEPRTQGRPVYYSDVVVRADHPATRLEDLGEAVWAYNDRCSWSGYLAVRRALTGRGKPTLVRSGGHRASLRLVDAGAVGAAAVDSGVLRLARSADPTLDRRVRVIASLGPHPVQPVVARASAGAGFAVDVAAALLAAVDEPRCAPALAAAGVAGFAPVSDADYDPERAALASDLAASTMSSSPRSTVAAAGPSGT